MEQSSTAADTLAHWQIPADDWKNFVDYELRTQLRVYRAYRKWFFRIIACALLIMAFFVFVPRLIYGSWDWSEDVYGPVFGIAVVAGILLLVVGVFRLLQRNRIAGLRAPTGDVRITLDGVRINGAGFDWVYRQNGWQIKEISRRNNPFGDGTKLEIIEFVFFSRNPGGDIEYQEKTERVPVPTGKSFEADKIIQRIEAEKSRFAQQLNYE